MAIDANIFLSTAASAAYLNPTIWSEAIEQFARENTVMMPLGVIDNRGVGTAMEQLNIARNNEYTAADLTEGTATPVTALSFGQVVVTYKETGLAKQVSELQLAYGLSSVFNDIVMTMGEALAVKRDVDIIAEITANATGDVYPNGHAAGTIVAADVLSTDVIADAKTTNRVARRPGKYLVIHPLCENSLIKDTAFVDASIYGGREVVLGGEIGKYLGMKVISYARIQSATENSITVYKNLLIGDRAFVFAQKIPPKIRWAEDSVLDRAVTFEAHESYGVKTLNADAITVMTAAPGLV